MKLVKLRAHIHTLPRTHTYRLDKHTLRGICFFVQFTSNSNPNPYLLTKYDTHLHFTHTYTFIKNQKNVPLYRNSLEMDVSVLW